MLCDICHSVRPRIGCPCYGKKAPGSRGQYGRLDFLGTDLKYMDPGRSNYVFSNNKVYVPDFGFNRQIEAKWLSPLDVPYKPFSLKIFQESEEARVKPRTSTRAVREFNTWK